MSGILREAIEIVAATIFFLLALIIIGRFTKYSSDSSVLESLNQKTQVHSTYNVGDNKDATKRYETRELKTDYRTSEDVIAEVLGTYETKNIYINGAKLSAVNIKKRGVQAIPVEHGSLYQVSSGVGDGDDGKQAIETGATYYTKVH